MTKQEGNKLIAEFMGLECDIMDGKLILRAKGKRYWYGKLYDEDWNELMNVVSKIESLAEQKTGHISVNIVGSGCEICQYDYKKIVQSFDRTTKKIENVWHCVAEFIKWYNLQSL